MKTLKTLLSVAFLGGSRNLVGITIQLSNSEEKELFIRYSMQISSE